ncbi:hypothetical protein [Streptomyces sp. NBC_01187]|uniref:hypothetical protein n=1 Tax=Streptomyces sp. NBC_01187 TaxID=2903766 RepID=UPI003864CB11|nr:hypothetical protein OG220_21660 [Streptomyces sp. NBC_01187]
MLLAIGDVVRDRQDDALGTVAGMASGVVLLRLNDAVRPVPSTNVEMVARAVKPRTPTMDVASLCFIALGLIIGALMGIAIAQLDGGTFLIASVTFTSTMTVISGLSSLFMRPRRIRV